MKKLTAFICAALCAGVITACAAQTQTDMSEETSAQVTASETAEETTAETLAAPIEYEIDPTKPVIALTFDDGPNITTTLSVLKLLEKYQVRASFFLVGNNITESTEKIIRRADEMGCEIDNHSRSHNYMNKLTAEEIKEEVDFVSEKVEEIIGKPTKFFRPPFIAVNETMYENIDMPFICGYGCNDWDSNVSTEDRINGVLESVKDGAIILLHDSQGNNATVEALDTIIPSLLEQGYQFATVSELFEAKGVEISGDDVNLYSQVQ